MKTLILTHPAAKELDALPTEARMFVFAGLVRYAMNGIGDVKALSGRQGFRLRLGRYRVLFSEDSSTVLAIYVGKRETATYNKR
jgi:mRNA interferase RelE/StbE